MKTFVLEFFLVTSSLRQLVGNVSTINQKNFNFPLIGKEVLAQTLFILGFGFFILINLQIEASSLITLFLHNNGCKLLKLLMLLFSMLLAPLILPIFLVQKLNFFEFFFFYIYSIISFLLLNNVHNFWYGQNSTHFREIYTLFLLKKKFIKIKYFFIINFLILTICLKIKQ